MALILTRLRWALTLNGWRTSVVTLVFSVLGALYLLGLTALIVAGLVTVLPGQEVLTRGVTTVVVTSVVVLLWLVLPPLATGVDATLDPASFVLYPVRARTLVAGLLVSTFTTPVGLLTLLGLLGAAASWWDTPAALAVGLVGAVLSATTAVSLGYGVTGLMTSFTGRRRVREAISVALLVPLMLGGVVLAQVMESIDDVFRLAPTLAGVAAWTPFGAGPAAAWAAAEGAWPSALARLAVAALWALAALALWHLAIRRTVEPAPTASSAAPGAADTPMDLRWMGRPATDARTAIAARTQLYWFKDPRYMASLVVVPLMGVLLWFVSTTTPEGGAQVFLILGPLVAWALAFSISADIAYDHTAFHLHVVSGVRGMDDRVGRLLGLSGWAVPVVVVVAVGTAILVEDLQAIPALLGISLGTYGALAGLSSLSSARWIYPVPKPGDSPLKTPQGATARIALVQGVSLLASAALAVPPLIPVIAFMVTQDALWSWVSLAVGLAWGAVTLWLGLRWGARWYDRAQAETLQAVKSF